MKGVLEDEKDCIFLVVFVISGLSMADEVVWQDSATVELTIVKMENAPYPHESRENGYTSSGGTVYPKDPHYIDNSVAIVIPKGYKPGPKVDLVYYFHGHGASLEKNIPQHDLLGQFTKGGKNAIFIITQGPKNAGDSGCGKLDDEGGLKRLTDEVLDFLKSEGKISGINLGNVVLMGHSGGYRVIANILKHGGLEKNIKEVYLLDATYALLENYADWLQRNKKGRLISIFTAHLADDNCILMADLSRRKVKYALVSDSNLTLDDLKKNKVLFIFTNEVDHNHVPHGRDHIADFLMTSKILKDIK